MSNALPAVAARVRSKSRIALRSLAPPTPNETLLRRVAATHELFAKRSEPGGRNALIERYLALAHSLARRYARSGQPLDDLVQVASIGLVKSVDRFDPDRGVTFEAFAIPTILGELKRYHRDHGWSVRMPRRLQEESLRIKEIVPLIAQDLKRSPTIAEIAEHARLSEDEVLEAMDAQDAYAPISLDAPVNDENDTSTLIGRLAADVEGFETAEGWADLRPRLRTLTPRERKIVILRFFRDWTQSQIAHEFGISQMHVSRLLSGSLRKLRTAIAEER